MMHSRDTILLSFQDTQVLKGVALILLLCHHCLYTGEDYDDMLLFGTPLFKSFGVFCKLCVAMFVFLSGYGLTIKALANKGIGNLFVFYRRRYIKLMINYWLIWFVFVPIGVFFFHRTIPSVYGNKYLYGLVSDLLGVHQMLLGHPYGYNATWWFYSCIIMLYLLYPIIWRCRRFWFILIPFSVMFPVITSAIPIIGSSNCGPWLLSFIVGMVLAYLKPEIGRIDILGKVMLISLLPLICLFRFHCDGNTAVYWDTAIIVIGIVVYIVFSWHPILIKGLAFVGKHSYNIFLFHTFIYLYYFHEYIYWSRNPLIIVTTLLVVCLIISIGIDEIRRVMRIDILQKKLLSI